MPRTFTIPYAIRNGEIVHVDDVERGLQPDCHCPVCHDVLIARKGEVMAHHFAHPSKTTCNRETVLHAFAKRLLVEKIQAAMDTKSALPMDWKCTQCARDHRGNLVKKATRVAMEMLLDGCRPDVVLLGPDDSPVAIIEVIVTHAPEDNVHAFCKDRGVVLITQQVGGPIDLEIIRRNDVYRPDSVGLCTQPKCQTCRSPLLPRELKIVTSTCWKCNAPMKVALLSLDDIFLLELDLMNSEERRIASKHGVILQRRRSKTAGETYLTSVCGSCNAFVGRFFSHHHAILEGDVFEAGMLCYECYSRERNQ